MGTALATERKRKHSGWPTLRRLMRERGIDEQQLAAQIGVTPRAIRSYIYGEVKPPVDRVSQIAAALKTTEVELRQDGPLPPIFA